MHLRSHSTAFLSEPIALCLLTGTGTRQVFRVLFFLFRFFALISFHSLTLYRATDAAISTSNETMKTNCRRDTSYQLVIEFSLSQFPCRYPGLLKGSPYSLSTTAIDGGLASIDLSKETD